jgi:hypothetical protein
MSTKVSLALLAALAVLQLGAAGSSIVRYERILATGAVYRIRTAAVDPADAFRGRYVAVQPSIVLSEPVDETTRALLDGFRIDGRPVFVELAADAEGFATAARVTSERPGGDYLEVEAAWPRWDTAGGSSSARRIGYVLTFGFNRYYMNEAAAPAAERRYAESVGPDRQDRAWVAVRVRDGIGVIEGLFVDGVPIEQAISR